MKKIFVLGWLVILAAGVAMLFWYNELQYSLPTPVPSDYRPVAFGKKISADSKLSFGNTKPIFLHFFNPDCPCSRFNIAYFKSLVRQYSMQVNFTVVLLSGKYYTSEAVKKKFDLTVPVIVDPGLAIRCGVYATPQAAIIDQDGKLFYRGNYNRSRYCTDDKTQFAKMALQGLFKQNTRLTFNQLALKAYGCRLPNCTL